MNEVKHWNTPLNDIWWPFVGGYGGGLMKAPSYGDYTLIDIRKGEDGQIETVEPKQLHPAWNCYGWYWRPSVFEVKGKLIEGTLASGKERP